MGQIVEIPIGKIEVGNHELRLDMEDEGIEGLARSISRLGVLVPLHVVCKGGCYTVVCGHRRLRAARRTSLEKLPCIVVDTQEDKERETSFAENFFRRDLSPVELACALKDCYTKASMTVKELAAGFHKSEHWVHSMIAIADWPSDVQEAIHVKAISVSAGANLACVNGQEYRAFLVRNAVEQGATARTTAAWLQAYQAMQPPEAAVTAEPLPFGVPAIPLVPQAPCLCCSQLFKVNEMSHVPVCGACIQLLRIAGTSGGVQSETPTPKE